MFLDTDSFNGDISRWNTAAVTDMGYAPRFPSLAHPPFAPPAHQFSLQNLLICAAMEPFVVRILHLTRSAASVRAAFGGVVSDRAHSRPNDVPLAGPCS
eukprot:1331905-Rhodomonas_salina.1